MNAREPPAVVIWYDPNARDKEGGLFVEYEVHGLAPDKLASLFGHVLGCHLASAAVDQLVTVAHALHLMPQFTHALLSAYCGTMENVANERAGEAS